MTIKLSAFIFGIAIVAVPMFSKAASIDKTTAVQSVASQIDSCNSINVAYLNEKGETVAGDTDQLSLIFPINDARLAAKIIVGKPGRVSKVFIGSDKGCNIFVGTN